MGGHDNYSTGRINIMSTNGDVMVGGLYGRFANVNHQQTINHCYSTVEIAYGKAYGSLVGSLSGIVENSFTNKTTGFYAKTENGFSSPRNCMNLFQKYYDSSLGFDQDIWEITTYSYPTLK